MTYTVVDVGDRIVDGRHVPLTDAEKQAIADEWNANEAQGAARQSAAQLEEKRRAALVALQEETLGAALLDQNAPLAVKAYAAVLQLKP